MQLWRIDSAGRLRAIEHRSFPSEKILEDLLERHPDLLGQRLLVLSRQPKTDDQKVLDLLAIDAHGRLVVIENKRKSAEGPVVAQAFEYASWVYGLSLDDLGLIFSQYRHGRGASVVDLSVAYEEHFGIPLGQIAPTAPRILVVANEMDDRLAASISFLAETHGIDIDAVLLQPFEDGLLARTDGWHTHKPSESTTTTFWDAWIPHARSMLDPYVRLQSSAGKTSMSKSLIQGLPGDLVVRLNISTALVSFELKKAGTKESHTVEADKDLHAVMMCLLLRRRAAVEQRFGGPLDWPTTTAATLRVSAGAIPIGDKNDPTAAGPDLVARAARDLVTAVLPELAAIGAEARRTLAIASTNPTPDEIHWPQSATIDLRDGSSVWP